MSTNFTEAQNAALAQQDRIPLADGYHAVSADRILDTGNADVYQDDTGFNQTVAWGNGDAFNQAADRIEAAAQAALKQRIQEDPDFRAAYDRIINTNPPNSYPDPADLRVWDQAAADAVSQAHDQEAFSHYRTNTDDGLITRSNLVNDSVLLDKMHDCETHSILEVSMLERLNRGMLDDKGSRYFYAAGNVRFSEGTAGAHAFIIATPPDGSGDIAIIEGTTSNGYNHYGIGSSYNITDNSFADLVSGETIISQDSNGDKNIYGTYSEGDDYAAYSNRISAIQNGDFSALSYHIYSYDDDVSVQAYYNSLANQYAPGITITDEASDNPLTNFRNEAPDTYTFLFEDGYFKSAYDKFVAEDPSTQHGDSVLIEDYDTGHTFLVTGLSTGEMEIKTVTNMAIPPELGLQTLKYDNDFQPVEPTPVEPTPVEPEFTSLSMLLGTHGVMDFNQDIWDIQQALKDAGYEIDVDGEAGPQTRQVVEDYIQENGHHLAYAMPASDLISHIQSNTHSSTYDQSQPPVTEPSYAISLDQPPYTFNLKVQEAQQRMSDLAQKMGIQGVDLATSKNPVGDDGCFGAKTEQAVMAVQSALGMQPTGIITSEFMDRMEEAQNDFNIGQEVPSAWDEGVANGYYIAAAEMIRDQPSALQDTFFNSAKHPASEQIVEALMQPGNDGFGYGS